MVASSFLALPNGIPSHDTFRRVFMLIDPEGVRALFLGWVRTVFRRRNAPRQVAIDGKTVRRSFDRKHGRSPLHLVSAYATEHGLVLAQRATESKGGELAVLPELLDSLDLRGCLVSLDALACRPEIAERIVGRGGDYLLALKGNQRKVHAEVRNWFAANAFAPGALADGPYFDAFDESHGRLVRRRVFACPDVGAFAALTTGPGSPRCWRSRPSVGSTEGQGHGRDPALRLERQLPPEALAAAIRSHWRI